jgi:hypothetical protein
MGCEEMLVEDVLKSANDELKLKIEDWKKDLKLIPFPPRIFRYTLIVGAFGQDIELLLADTDDEFRFLRSPYTRIAKSFVFKVPECHRQKISFLSPYPPKIRYVTPFWSSPELLDDGTGGWGGNSDSPLTIAVPSEWNNSHRHVAEMIYAEGKSEIAPADPSEKSWVNMPILRCDK